jgi:hypothetical protein
MRGKHDPINVPSRLLQTLAALSGMLSKAEAHAGLRKVDSTLLLSSRLAPDRFPLSQQVEIACDFAKSTLARLAGLEVPNFKDEGKSLAEVRARIGKTLDYVRCDHHVGRQPRHLQGPGIPRALRAAELLLSCHRRLRHPAP